MGAGASAVGPPEESVKLQCCDKIAEIISKEFENLKSKALSPEDLKKEIVLLLKMNEAQIITTPPPVGLPNFSGENKMKKAHKKGSRRRSFDHLILEEKKDPDSYPIENQLSLSGSGRILLPGEKANSEEQFREMCVNSVKKIATKKSLTYMCAVDGSDGGHIAFQTMMLLKRRLDHICVFHTFSKEHVEELPAEYRPDAVRSRYEGELISTYKLPTTKFAFFWEEKKGRAIRQVIMELLNNYRGAMNPMRPTKNEPNFFFCGYTGTKGTKVENSTLGSVTDIALRSVHMPVVICKHVCSPSTRKFIIAVDGSENSRNGFEIAMALINPKDKLYCVYVSKTAENEGDASDPKALPMSPTEITEYYTTELNNYGPADSEFLTLNCSPDKHVSECLVEFSDSVEADFFAISPRTKPRFTTITEFIIVNVKANIILCKH